jgi:uncharacterized protein (DUF362 family)
MKRRKFLKASGAAWASAVAAPYVILTRKSSVLAAERPDVVAVHGGEPAEMVDRALASLGGMGLFIKKGQTVLVKPNMSWRRPVENGANTNPHVVKRVVEHCIDAGAKRVYLMDHTVDAGDKAYEESRVGPASEEAGGVPVQAGDESKYQTTKIPGAVSLDETKVHPLYLEADAVVNVPVLKHHGRTKVTIAMKNLMGVVWDRRAYHKDKHVVLNQRIADFLLLKKPVVNIVDAFRVTMAHGPHRAKPEDVVVRKALFASADIVAVDSAASAFHGTDPKTVDYIRIAHEMKIGNMDLGKQKVDRIEM